MYVFQGNNWLNSSNNRLKLSLNYFPRGKAPYLISRVLTWYDHFTSYLRSMFECIIGYCLHSTEVLCRQQKMALTVWCWWPGLFENITYEGVMRFGRKGKLNPRYVGLFEILQLVGEVAYELALHAELASVQPVFHFSMLKKWIVYPTLILPIEGSGVDENISYEEVPIEILDRQVKWLRNKDIAAVKEMWRNHRVEGVTWEAEANMRSCYPHLFIFWG